jgi:hypothetical protein
MFFIKQEYKPKTITTTEMIVATPPFSVGAAHSPAAPTMTVLGTFVDQPPLQMDQ